MPRLRLIRYIGLYSSKSRCKHAWKHITKHAPGGWREEIGMKFSEDDPKIEGICDCDIDNNLY